LSNKYKKQFGFEIPTQQSDDENRRRTGQTIAKKDDKRQTMIYKTLRKVKIHPSSYSCDKWKVKQFWSTRPVTLVTNAVINHDREKRDSIYVSFHRISVHHHTLSIIRRYLHQLLAGRTFWRVLLIDKRHTNHYGTIKLYKSFFIW